MHVASLLSGQKEHINTKCSDSSGCFSSSSLETENPCTFSSLTSSCSSPSNLRCEKTKEPQSLQTKLSLLFSGPAADNSEDEHLKESSNPNSSESSDLYLENLATEVVKQVLYNALNVMNDQSGANQSDCFNKTGQQTDCVSTDGSCECKVFWHSVNKGRRSLEGKEEKAQDSKGVSGVKGQPECFRNWEEGSRDADQENVLNICCHGTRCHTNRPGLNEFKEFLQGTPGEKLLNLWMDIERLKATHNTERKNR